MIIPTPPERLDRVQEALRAQMTEAGAVERPVRNESVVRSIVEGDLFEYPNGSGRWYHVPPVEYLTALEIQRVVRDERALRARRSDDEETLRALAASHTRMMRLLKRLSRPVSRWRRLAWRLTRNPFRRMTTADAGQLLVFCYGLTTRSHVRFSVGSQRAAPETSPAR